VSHDLPAALAPPQPQPPTAGPVVPRRPGLQPRTVLLLLSLFVCVLLVAVVAMLPVPYVVLSEGPALNTLSAPNGKPLIEISGRPTYPASGGLYLTTVSVLGGPRPVTLPTVLRAWLDPDEAAVPVDAVFPPGQTAQQADEQTREEMTGSQSAATAAALQELGIPVTISVGALVGGVPAARVLKAGDVLLSVQGHAVTGYSSLRSAVTGVAPGQVVSVHLRRGGREQTVDVTTTKDQARRTALGVVPRFAFPFTVKIQINDIGGPSAGTMFALGIIDKLTPGNLTGGQQIAGTGEIGPDGTVSPIGGIAEKMIGARHVGARWFLAPADNCTEVVGHVPDGLRVVRISTLHGARQAVEAIAQGGAAASSLPTCS
jgi:Lon-like protease